MITVLPTLDGDPGASFPQRRGLADQAPGKEEIEGYRKAVSRLFSIFDSCGLLGKVTWFVNERDVHWTTYYPDLLGEIIRRNDTLALHVHYDGLFTPGRLSDFESALAACRQAKENLESLCGKPCICHRSGCFFQSEYIYRCVEQLGIKLVSDVFPGFKGAGAGGGFVDNSMIPMDVKPWRHSSGNWLDYKSKKGNLLHVPVAFEGIGSLRDLPTRIRHNKMELACWDFHPHELQNADGSLNEKMADILTENLLLINKELAPANMNFEEFMRLGIKISDE